MSQRVEDECRRLVHAHFKNQTKTDLWFNSDNPQLGGISPNDMIAMGREMKLLRTIRCMLAMNKPR